MTGPSAEEPTPEERIRAELRELRDQVVGVRGSMVATSDGFLVTHDIPDLEPTRIAALVAATFGLARQATETTGRGRFREAVARGAEGYLAVFAVSDSSVVAVVGTNDLNIGMLHYQTRDMVKRISGHMAEFDSGWQGHALPDGPPGTMHNHDADG
ncbi:roadblock/LC7 domain-containing protein [Planotetraspora sp. A-T 1434]|uniref:roadblock/LC7 domain-containing protein n=1 Tax=Planotetraspora sp. A-T 1434 TaxID=2979219 RepID=UPI0021C0B313|nr:roadblock/LC7 domain-containing protein [Planotetraspora sp. A-T 1434]MCT9928679.1 roadblock/LC7 domain-containing protein [Planotetraspora sp. A-T 1434]